jgi:ubiquinone/menaquinone biosynthesis C-methylase UbiE
MSRLRPTWRWVPLMALTALTAYLSSWLRDSVDARARVRIPSMPAAAEPAAARAEQRLADTPLWRWIEARLVQRAMMPFRVRPGLHPLRILNVEHGPGGVAQALGMAAPQDALVVATDARAGMAQLARERTRRRGTRAAVAFVRAAPDRLPFGAATFDLDVTAGALHDWRDPEGVLRELARTLAPSGRYLIADLRRDVTLAMWLLLRLVQSLGAPRDLRALDEPSASFRAAYASPEAEWLAARAKLPDLNVQAAAAWLIIERGAVPPQPSQKLLPISSKENRR